MHILYIGIHAILEFDELKLFTELGHDCFSVGGAYADPKGHYSLPRPEITGMQFHDDLFRAYNLDPRRTALSDMLISWPDVIIVMGGYGDTNIIDLNWDRLRNKPVIWRTIGQSTEVTETIMDKFKKQGMRIVRMSPKEKLIPNYIGEDALIRFYKDPEEYKDWNGHNKKIINFSQSLKGRGDFLHYDEIMKILVGHTAQIFGTGNEDLGGLNGGNINYNQLKEQLRDNRVFLYAGTWPSPYTLSLIEAMMTGIPVVAIGKQLAEHPPRVKTFEFYEVHELIKNGENGFVADTIDELCQYIELLLNDYGLAQKISQQGRQTAIEYFAKDKIKGQWQQFFSSL